MAVTKTQRSIHCFSAFIRKTSNELWRSFHIILFFIPHLLACCPLSWLFLLMWLLIKFERYLINETLFFYRSTATRISFNRCWELLHKLCRGSLRTQASFQYSWNSDSSWSGSCFSLPPLTCSCSTSLVISLKWPRWSDHSWIMSKHLGNSFSWKITLFLY